MKLRDLFSDEIRIDTQARTIDVSGLAMDSRTVKPGDLFFALAGSKTDGARFIDAAVAAGAAAVVGDQAPQSLSVPSVTTTNPRRALALAAAKFCPKQPTTIAAVTGTSGKTSVAAFTRQIWQRLGHASARAAILKEAKGAREIGDRAQAIRTATEELQSGDALLIAGKGHETGQIVGDKILHFSDHEAVAAELASRVA
jgi:UDP-N-acetylmuramyl tripeptide synthase